jgi:hypothetical protein
METERTQHSITPDDATPSDRDAPDHREITAPDSDQDPVEEPDADREPGHTKS